MEEYQCDSGREIMVEREAMMRLRRSAIPTMGSATFAAPLWGAAPALSADGGVSHAPTAGFDFGSAVIHPPQPLIGPEGGAVGPAIADRIRAQQGNGAALELNVQRKMEAGFGHNFADVRVHADGEADTLSRSVSANAFTLGSDIFLSREAATAGAYGGDRLLAHELTHVVQQRGASQGGTLSVSASGDREEHEAAAVADAVSAGNPGRVPAAVQHGRAGIAPMRIQRDKETSAQDMAEMKRQMAEMQQDMAEMKQQQAVGKNKQAATALDLRWRGIFGERMASYKQAIWRITGGIDAAAQGFSDAQVAQSQTDQLEAQFFGLVASVAFAGAFEWVAGMGLKGLGTAATKIGSRVKDVDTAVAEIGEGAAAISLPGGPGMNMFSRVGARLKDPSSIIETVENPANAAFGGYMTNIRGAERQQSDTARIAASVDEAGKVTGEGHSPNIYPPESVFNLLDTPDLHEGSVFNIPIPPSTPDAGAAATPASGGQGGGAMAFLAAKSEALEKHSQDIEQAFVERSKQLDALDDTKWAGFNISEQERVYQGLLDELNASASGIEKMQTPEIVAEVIEKYMWADWILHSAQRESSGRLWNFGTDIDLRLIKIGVEREAGVGLSEHWWQHSSDDWGYAITRWAGAYKGSIVK
jgi:hypothetical protein